MDGRRLSPFKVDDILLRSMVRHAICIDIRSRVDRIFRPISTQPNGRDERTLQIVRSVGASPGGKDPAMDVRPCRTKVPQNLPLRQFRNFASYAGRQFAGIELLARH